MEKRKYKFENYRDKDFPVYSSEQAGVKHLVHPHFHEDMEIILVADGKIMLSAGTAVHQLEKGDIAVLLPSVTHSVVSLTENARIKGLVFNTKVLNQPISFSLDTACFILSENSPHYSKFRDEFDKAVYLYHNHSFAYKMEMCSRLLMLLVILTEAGMLMPESGDSLQKRLTPALDYISEHFSQPIKISELSSLLCVCDDHFIRLFKTATSRTPSEYITDMRVSNAMRLLSTDTYSVSEIAEKTGFLNSAYFSKIFKKKLGITPTKYRKNIL